MALLADVKVIKASEIGSAKKQSEPAPMLPVPYEDDKDKKAVEVKVVANVGAAELSMSQASLLASIA